MIRFSLRCANQHLFDSWFASGEAFDTLRVSGRLSCPDCGDASIEKTLMAPCVGTKPEETRAVDTAAAAARRKIETTADYVGTDFTREARAIHTGEQPPRAIYGEARPDQVRALVSEGVAIAPLPFVPKRKIN